MPVKKINKTETQWKEELTAEQYEIARNKGTERAFTGKYNTCKDDGIYRCSSCGQELFDSKTKYDSGSGWPSFYAPENEEFIITETDSSLGMTRTEVMCAACDAHLGHVFPDGPAPSGMRYCINSVSLSLDKNNKS